MQAYSFEKLRKPSYLHKAQQFKFCLEFTYLHISNARFYYDIERSRSFGIKTFRDVLTQLGEGSRQKVLRKNSKTAHQNLTRQKVVHLKSD